MALKILKDYNILGGTLEERYVNTLLGKVVRDREYPLAGGFEPENFVPQDLIKTLMGNTGIIEEVSETDIRRKTDAASARLTAFLSAHVKREEGVTATLHSANLKSYEMIQIAKNVRLLNQEPAWANPVKDLFRRTGKDSLPMVTKILTCDSITITYTEDSDKGAGADITVPVTALATNGAVLQGPADVNTKLDVDRIQKVTKSKTISTKVILALAYSEARYQPVSVKDRERQVVPSLSASPTPRPRLSFSKRLRILFKGSKALAEELEEAAEIEHEVIIREDGDAPVYYTAVSEHGSDTTELENKGGASSEEGEQ